MKTSSCRIVLALAACLLSAQAAFAAGAASPCPRPAAGSPVARPPDLGSRNGLLSVMLDYRTAVDGAGRTLFCLVTPDGLQSPTLHVSPGDTLDITVRNQVPALPPGSPTEIISDAFDVCGDRTMTETSVNLHFHGTNTSPACHGDDAVRTIINSGQAFRYTLHFPADEPPGVYWYHPHVHGIAEAAVLGGASGAIIVDGIETLQPAVAGLPERVLIVRDQTVGAAPVAGGPPPPAWDVSLNDVPISYPFYSAPALDIQPNRHEFWRVVNASADTIIDLALRFDGHAQPLELVALDGVPVSSQDGTRHGRHLPVDHALLPPGARAEFIIPAIPADAKSVKLVTRAIDTGPDGDFDPERPLLVLHAAPGAPAAPALPAGPAAPWQQRFEGLAATPVSARRTLYFSEVVSDPSNPASPTNFFITVDGATPRLFDPTNPPAITTRQGAVEEWTIENRSQENHEFHIHQIHFQLLGQNFAPASPYVGQFLDTIQVPYWTGTGPYPKVTVRMDFRGPVVGDFVYHCHILGHEDNGMMAIIRVLPRG